MTDEDDQHAPSHSRAASLAPWLAASLLLNLALAILCGAALWAKFGDDRPPAKHKAPSARDGVAQPATPPAQPAQPSPSTAAQEDAPAAPLAGSPADALAWLAAHQDADGKWDCDDFSKHDPENDQASGAGDPTHDVGVTGLALLAFLGDGNVPGAGPHKDVVARGLEWLVEQQDPETGNLGDQISHSFLYDHAIATLALCEALNLQPDPELKSSATRAVEFILRARNPYRVWRYSVPPDGENDTSITGWMVSALRSAADAGLPVDKEALVASIEWFNEMTDDESGRVGYIEKGSRSSRVVGVNEDSPVEATEALTAIALLSRFFLDQEPDEHPVMKKHADLLLKSLPQSSADGSTNDMIYWYYGSHAMYQMGGEHWRRWSEAMKSAAGKLQREDGAAAGSFDPNGPWGYSGGRIYSTALMALAMQSVYRYGRVLESR